MLCVETKQQQERIMSYIIIIPYRAFAVWFCFVTASGVLVLVDNGLPNPDRGTAFLT